MSSHGFVPLETLFSMVHRLRAKLEAVISGHIVCCTYRSAYVSSLFSPVALREMYRESSTH